MRQRLHQRGLLRPMLKLPAIRGELQVRVGHGETLNGLCANYEEACVALERFKASKRPEERAVIEEYETLCSNIESDIILICLQDRSMPRK
ncbi:MULTISPECIES: hypothetical protein [unclassified Rhizobium]|uniref:hypothetical protein n=1 Tax=unclassified Rhizobium TaxID=2613769 RepID=UPI001C83C4A8|nr:MULTISPECIES: hypothetical protein [unclassified Rhizobium]MBX5163225.1 hypothetical protein [Rhizobium sp. NZLR4b]MBX5183856.1 hypothetical protein [Rhizobium sp. NZLR5]MBX5207644.1 hypothetical protein [Rhizobium sp. NZLR11]